MSCCSGNHNRCFSDMAKPGFAVVVMRLLFVGLAEVMNVICSEPQQIAPAAYLLCPLPLYLNVAYPLVIFKCGSKGTNVACGKELR